MKDLLPCLKRKIKNSAKKTMLLCSGEEVTGYKCVACGKEYGENYPDYIPFRRIGMGDNIDECGDYKSFSYWCYYDGDAVEFIRDRLDHIKNRRELKILAITVKDLKSQVSENKYEKCVLMLVEFAKKYNVIDALEGFDF